ncbi:ABC transporter substrate-binding protein [Pelagibacterium halotolerans]|uniref:ABC transporter substrate-binding protein n=1 Tax=Pelagibacterium halotolerans TaxID=531813 RepID=UPI00384DC258
MIRFLRIAAVSLAAAVSAPVMAQDFPLTIEHKFGTTVIADKPERIASVDYGGADNLLALGIQPVTIRYWYGDYPRGVWPWADDFLEGEPALLQGDLDFEAIAATDPDVIIALYSGITDKDYEALSRIAPVVAVPEGVGDYALAWDELAITVGRAVGEAAAAQEQVDAIRARLADIAAEHPEWAGKSAAIGNVWLDTPGAYTSRDVRQRILEAMGFVTPPAIDALAQEDDFYVDLSPEDLSPIDADVTLWFFDETLDPIHDLTAWRFMASTQEGRDAYLGPLLTGAFSHASLLSLPYTIGRLEPILEAALDGDPQTHADDRP